MEIVLKTRSRTESCPDREDEQVSASRETNRTQLLLHKPPHPAVRGPVCCCSWLIRLWESREEGGAAAAAAVEFDRLRSKAKRTREEEQDPPSL